MIGYLTPHKPDLRMKEFQVYQAYSCGLCKTLGDRYGLTFRNLLLNEGIFLGLFLDALAPEPPAYKEFRCLLHPFRKKLRVIPSKNMEYAADISVFAFYHKLQDNIRDEHSLLSAFLKFFIARKYRKASKRLGGLASKLLEYLEEMRAMEKGPGDRSKDLTACYGRFTREIFTRPFREDPRLSRIAGEIGFDIGEWMVQLDAFDDLEKDLNKKMYNPLAAEFGICSDKSHKEWKSEISSTVFKRLLGHLEQASKAFDLTDPRYHRNLLLNIFYEGMYHRTRTVVYRNDRHGK